MFALQRLGELDGESNVLVVLRSDDVLRLSSLLRRSPRVEAIETLLVLDLVLFFGVDFSFEGFAEVLEREFSLSRRLRRHEVLE